MTINGASKMAGNRLATRIFLRSSKISEMPRINTPPVAVSSIIQGVVRLTSAKPPPKSMASPLMAPCTTPTVMILTNTPGPSVAAKGMAAKPAILNAAQDGHRADTEDQAGGDKATRDAPA